jgi:hypothetical protein
MRENSTYGLLKTRRNLFFVLYMMSNTVKSKRKPSAHFSLHRQQVYPDTDEIFRLGIRNGLGMPTCLELFSMAAEFRPLLFRNEEEKRFLVELRNELVRLQRYPML